MGLRDPYAFLILMTFFLKHFKKFHFFRQDSEIFPYKPLYCLFDSGKTKKHQASIFSSLNQARKTADRNSLSYERNVLNERVK